MARGSISHIALTVSDLDRSTEFYDQVFKFIGYKSVEVPESTQQAMKTRLKAWIGPGYSISIRPSKGEFAHRPHDRNAPGFNHMAFSAESRSDVEKLYELLVAMGTRVLDAPAEYPYSPDTSQSISLILTGLSLSSRTRPDMPAIGQNRVSDPSIACGI